MLTQKYSKVFRTQADAEKFAANFAEHNNAKVYAHHGLYSVVWYSPAPKVESIARNQRGNILPELLMLFFVLFAVGTCSISTAQKYDQKITRIINNSLELKDLNH